MSVSMTTTDAMIATGLGKRFGKHWALKESNLQIPQGRISALVGPNGAGKTTLLQLATGLLSPTAGTVRTLGFTPDRDTELLPLIGFVAQLSLIHI